jgi:general secretion pathway protein M
VTVLRWNNRFAAIALMASMLVALYSFIVAPLVTSYGETDRAISQAGDLLWRYKHIGRSQDAHRARLKDLKFRQLQSGIYLGGSTDALAGAELQDLVNKTVEASGGRLRSIQILPVEIDEEFRRIGVRVKMTATGAELVRVLYAIEAGPTFLFVDNLDVRNERARRNQPNGKDPTLDIRVNFFGYLRPDVG